MDLGLSLATGYPLGFAPTKLSFNPQLSTDGKMSIFPELDMLSVRPDPRLLHIWADMRTLATTANEHQGSQSTVVTRMFSKFFETVPPRLLGVTYGPISEPELLRLSMLIICKALLTPIPGFGRLLKALAQDLQLNIVALSHDSPLGLRPLLLWSAFLASIFIFEDMDVGWLRSVVSDTLNSLRIYDWQSARAILKQFIWFDEVFDSGAEQLFYKWMT